MPWWAGRLGAGFVTAILIGAVLTPMFFMNRENAIREEIRSYVVPANIRTAQMQTALSHELSGIIGFQAAGQPRFADMYTGERNRLLDALNDLSRLADRIDGNAQDRWRDLATAIVQWHAAVEQEAFLKTLMDRRRFTEELFQSERLLQEARQAATDFDFAVQKATEQRRERIARLQRESSLLISIVAVMAVLSLSFVWRLAKQLRDAQTRLLAAATEEKNLVKEAESRRALAENAVRVRDDILRIVSHDLRNPLSIIVLTTSMLRNAPEFVTEDTRRLLHIIKRGTDRMNILIRNLVEIGKLEAGQDMTLDMTEFTPDSVIRDACELAKLDSEQKKILLSSESIEPRLPLEADRERLLQVLNNLIDNAIKFTPQGGAVTVRSESNRSEVRFSVSDTGIGIGEEHLSRIFEQYWQVPVAGAKRGTGLGLAIAKRIVERHGGRIWAESRFGQGTTFHFVVPRFASLRRENIGLAA